MTNSLFNPDLPPERKRLFVRVTVAVGIFACGAIVGIALSPETPASSLQHIDDLTKALGKAHARILELERAEVQRNTTVAAPNSSHALSPRVIAQHRAAGKKYVRALRAAKAQSAADLVRWFLSRWEDLLKHPQSDDRLRPQRPPGARNHPALLGALGGPAVEVPRLRGADDHRRPRAGKG